MALPMDSAFLEGSRSLASRPAGPSKGHFSLAESETLLVTGLCGDTVESNDQAATSQEERGGAEATAVTAIGDTL